MSEWEEKTLGDLLTLKRGYDLPEQSRKKGTVPIYSSSGISGFHSTSKSNPPGVVTGRYGSIGSVFLCTEPFWPLNTTLYVQDFKGSDELFVYYFLKKINWHKFNDKSAVPGINRNDLHAEPVLVPPVSEQKQIAAVLSCLDRKIENLRKQNETLERIAQTLFKHWFVDFEFPNDEGKPYKSSGGEMVRSELGEIPVGWRVGKLGDEFDVCIGRTPPRKESEWFSTNNSHIKWISIKDMGSCGVYILETSEYLTREAVRNFRIPVIPRNTVILSFKLTVGRISITIEEMLSNEAIAHLKVFSKSPKSEYIYLFLSQFNFDKLGSTSSIATAVNSKSIKGIEFLVPSKELASDFSKIISPVFWLFRILYAGFAVPNEFSRLSDLLYSPKMFVVNICIRNPIEPVFSKLRINTLQIQKLIKTRDVLLPKLISGQLRIAEGGS